MYTQLFSTCKLLPQSHKENEIMQLPNNAKSATPEQLVRTGRILIDSQEYKKAIENLDQAIELKPDYGLAYVYRGFARYWLGDTEGMSADHKQALEINPKLPELYVERAKLFVRKGNFQDAIAEYTRAIKVSSRYDSRNNYAARAHARLNVGDTMGAIADYTYSIGILPTKAEFTLIQRGYVWMNLGEFDEAKRDFFASLHIARGHDSDNGKFDAYVSLGEVSFAQEEFDEAIRWYEGALKIDKSAADVYSKIAEVMKRKQELDR